MFVLPQPPPTNNAGTHAGEDKVKGSLPLASVLDLVAENFPGREKTSPSCGRRRAGNALSTAVTYITKVRT